MFQESWISKNIGDIYIYTNIYIYLYIIHNTVYDITITMGKFKNTRSHDVSQSCGNMIKPAKICLHDIICTLK